MSRLATGLVAIALIPVSFALGMLLHPLVGFPFGFAAGYLGMDALFGGKP